MKTKIYLCYLLVTLATLAFQNTNAQTSYSIPITTVCGIDDLFININNPQLNRANYVFINGKYEPTAIMPSLVQSSTIQRSGIVIPSNLFKSGLNTISITGSDSRVAYRVPNGVVSIDGFLTESNWKLNNMVYGIMDANNPIPNGINSSLTFGLLWDDDNLYISVKAIDTTMFYPTANDGVEIYLDPYNIDGCYASGFCSPTTYNQQTLAAKQLIVPYNAIDESGLLFWQNNDPGRSITGIKMSVKTFSGGSGYKLVSTGPSAGRLPSQMKGTGFIMEMAIPWYNFFNTTTLVGTAGLSFGFDMAYNDNQGRTNSGGNFTRNEQSFWNSSNLNNDRWNRTQNFGEITLVSESEPVNEMTTLVFTVLGVKPPLSSTSILYSGSCSSVLTITAPTFAGFTAYWQTTATAELTTDLGSIPKEFFTPVTSSGLFLNVQSDGGCWSETIPVEIIPANPSLSSVTSSVIYPDCGIAIITASGMSLPNISYFWQTTSTGISQTQNLASTSALTVIGPGSFTKFINTLNTVSGCWSLGNLSYTFDLTGTKPATPANLIGGFQNCSVYTVTSINKAPTGEKWYWQTANNGTSSTNQDSVFIPSAAGLVYLRANKFGCFSDNSSTFDVQSIVPPNLVKSADASYTQNESITQLTASANPSSITGVSVNWYTGAIGGTASVTAPTPTSATIGESFYYVSLSKDNCEIPRQAIKITILEPVISIFPKYGITPNGDVLNEKFVIDNITAFAGNKVVITDKWGNTVFEKENYDNSFDGKRNGKDLPFGSYLYYVDLNNGKSPLTGTIVITR